jgi:hypothetical protein
MGRHFRVNILEHVTHRGLATGMQRAVAFGLLLCGHHGIQNFGFRLLMAFVRPDTSCNQVIFEPDHGVAEWPGVGLGLRPVGGRIVGGGMSSDTVGDIFDERGTEITACPLGCPFRYSMDSKVVVAVDPEGRDAEAETARSECAGAAAGDALESPRSPTDC